MATSTCRLNFGLGMTGILKSTCTIKVYANFDGVEDTISAWDLFEIGNGMYTVTATGVLVPSLCHVYVTGTPTIEAWASIGDELGSADAVWDEASADHLISGSTGRRLRNIAQDVIWDGTAQSGSTSNTIILDSNASATDGAYDPAKISIISGTGAGQTRNILQYVGSTRKAYVDRDWRVTPDDSSVFMILSDAGREHVNEGVALGPGTGNNQIQLNANASTTDNAYVGQIIFIRSGTGSDQARRVASYAGDTQIATVTRDWAVNPDTTSVYAMLPTGSLSYECIRAAIGMETANLDDQLENMPAAVRDVSVNESAQDSVGEAISIINWATNMAMRAVYYQPRGNERPYLVNYHDATTTYGGGLSTGGIYLYARPYRATDNGGDTLLGVLSPADPNTDPAIWTEESVTVDFPALLIVVVAAGTTYSSGNYILQLTSNLTEERNRLGWNISYYGSSGGEFVVLANGALVDATTMGGGITFTGLSTGLKVWKTELDGAPAMIHLLHTAYARDLLGCPQFDPQYDPGDSFTVSSTGDMSNMRLRLYSIDERHATWNRLYDFDGQDWTTYTDFTDAMSVTGKFCLWHASGLNGWAAQDLTFTPTNVPYNNSVPFTVHMPATAAGAIAKFMYFDANGWPIDANGDYILQPITPTEGEVY